MFGLGIWEIALILAVALVVLGPQRLPAVAKQLGRGLRELRRAASDFQVTLEQEADAEEVRQRREKLTASLAEPPGSVPSPTNGPEKEAASLPPPSPVGEPFDENELGDASGAPPHEPGPEHEPVQKDES